VALATTRRIVTGRLRSSDRVVLLVFLLLLLLRAVTERVEESFEMRGVVSGVQSVDASSQLERAPRVPQPLRIPLQQVALGAHKFSRDESAPDALDQTHGAVAALLHANTRRDRLELTGGVRVDGGQHATKTNA